MNLSAPLTERRYVLIFALLTSLFFLWAIGARLEKFKKWVERKDGVIRRLEDQRPSPGASP